MYQPGEEMPMSPGYPGYYPPANMYMPYGPGMAYMGPPPHGMMMPPPPPGYEHLGQYQQQQQQQPSLQHGGEDGQEAPVAQGEGNGTIPPAEVSKSIPCKFFPNCRYGAQCAFQHPVQPPPPAFSPPPMAMYGYEQGPAYPPAFYPPFGYSSPPPGAMGMAPPMHSVSPPPPPQQGAYPAPPPATTVDYSNDAAFIVNPQNQGMPPFMPSAMAPPFAPAFQPQATTAAAASASAATVESETATDAAPAAQDEAAEAAEPAVLKGEATSAPAAQAPVQPQQQQQLQQHKGFPRKFGPFGAFPSKKFGPKSGAKWVGGNAPPCSFFLNNACRNGDMCRFPHLNAEGVDCRNPGVIDGSIAAAPISVLPGKPPRAPYAANNFPMSSKAMQNTAAGKVASRAAAAAASPDAAAPQATPEAVEGGAAAHASASEAAEPHIPSAATPAFVPGRHLGPAGVAANRQFAQARSQPASRPLSPTAGPHGGPVARGPRSLSAAPNGVAGVRRKDDKDAAALARQRVPSSDDFPALGGSVGSLKESTGSLAGSVPSAGKTAAQVLSAPAPAGANPSYAKQQPKKAAAPAVNKQAEDDKERQASKSSDDGQSSTSGKTSDSEDAVLVDAAKSAPSAPNGAPSPMPAAVKKIPSFAAATMVGAIKA